MKKVEGVRIYGNAKDSDKMAKRIGKFHGSYSRGSGSPTLEYRPIQSVGPLLQAIAQKLHSRILLRVDRDPRLRLGAVII